MAKRSNPVRYLLSPSKVYIPIAIGLVITAWLLYREFGQQQEAFAAMSWGWHSAAWFGVALIMVVLRDLGYMIRIRVLTEGKLNWRQSFDVIMLWEFATAATPAVLHMAVSGFAIFIVNRENVPLGRSTAVVMAIAFLDELFYALMIPLLLLAVAWSDLFPVAFQREFFGVTLGVREIFVTGYIFIVLLIMAIYLGIFRFPQAARTLIVRLFSIRFLKRWKQGAEETGNDLVTASRELGTKPFLFWLKAFAATFLTWTARFWLVNFLILSFTILPTDILDHLLIYARQLVMWLTLLISPTPGGSGLAEVAFRGFLGDFIAPIGLAVSLGVLWRLVSYYPYLVVGAIILPRWVQRVYLGRKLISFKKKG